MLISVSYEKESLQFGHYDEHAPTYLHLWRTKDGIGIIPFVDQKIIEHFNVVVTFQTYIREVPGSNNRWNISY